MNRIDGVPPLYKFWGTMSLFMGLVLGLALPSDDLGKLLDRVPFLGRGGKQ